MANLLPRLEYPAANDNPHPNEDAVNHLKHFFRVMKWPPGVPFSYEDFLNVSYNFDRQEAFEEPEDGLEPVDAFLYARKIKEELEALVRAGCLEIVLGREAYLLTEKGLKSF